MLKCKICGCEFNAVKETHYITRDNGKIGIAAALESKPEGVLFDTFDCPACGCQITAQERKRKYDIRIHNLTYLEAKNESSNEVSGQ